MFELKKSFDKIGENAEISFPRKKLKTMRFILRYVSRYFLDRFIILAPTNSFRIFFYKCMGLNIGTDVFIGDNVLFDRLFPEKITISDHSSIGDKCIITAHANIPTSTPLSSLYPTRVQEVYIGRGVWVMPGCIIIPGVHIDDYSVVATGSVVTKNIPSATLAGGVPAKVLKKLNIGKIE